jgi:hypothetical protein
MLQSDFDEGPVLVIHGQPVTPNLTLKDLEAIQRSAPILFPVSGIYQVSGRINRLGHEATMEKNGKLVNRSQIFRTSQVETISGLMHQGQEVLGLQLNEAIVRSIRNQLNFLEGQKFPWPFVFSIALLRVSHRWLVTEPSLFAVPHVDFQDDEIILPDVHISDWSQANSDQSLAQTIRPQLDEIWNASGYPASPDFSADGSWQGPRR